MRNILLVLGLTFFGLSSQAEIRGKKCKTKRGEFAFKVAKNGSRVTFYKALFSSDRYPATIATSSFRQEKTAQILRGRTNDLSYEIYSRSKEESLLSVQDNQGRNITFALSCR